MRAITTKLQGLCDTSIWVTTYKVTVSYQYMSVLSNCEMHLIRFILSYNILIYNKYVIILCSITNHNKTVLILENLESIALWYFDTQLFAADKYIYDPPKSVNHWQTSNIERQYSIRGLPMFLMDIMILIEIVWLQWLLVNTLL